MRQRKPKAHVDQQPAGVTPHGLDHASAGHIAAVPDSCLSGFSQLGDTFSGERLGKRGALAHDASFEVGNRHKSTCHKKSCQEEECADYQARLPTAV